MCVADQQSALSLVGSKVLICTFPCLFLCRKPHNLQPYSYTKKKLIGLNLSIKPLNFQVPFLLFYVIGVMYQPQPNILTTIIDCIYIRKVVQWTNWRFVEIKFKMSQDWVWGWRVEFHSFISRLTWTVSRIYT